MTSPEYLIEEFNPEDEEPGLVAREAETLTLLNTHDRLRNQSLSEEDRELLRYIEDELLFRSAHSGYGMDPSDIEANWRENLVEYDADRY